MSLQDILEEAKNKGFTKTERHFIGEVYRTAKEHENEEHGLRVAQEYLHAEYSKRMRRTLWAAGIGVTYNGD